MTKTSAASLITPAQTADMLGVSTATLRRYATQFKKHLSKYAKAKRRQYTQSDLATLVKARDYVRARVGTDSGMFKGDPAGGSAGVPLTGLGMPGRGGQRR